jgi:hypothetical protein
MDVKDLERAVSELPPQEFAEFAAWFEEFAADQWDRRIEADVVAGKLDQCVKKADEDFEAGRCIEL